MEAVDIDEPYRAPSTAEHARSKWVRFVELDNPGFKTKRWEAQGQGGYLDPLGVVHWYGAWRGYVFAPEGSTVYNPVCLNDIARFVQRETELHHAKLAVDRVMRKLSRQIAERG